MEKKGVASLRDLKLRSGIVISIFVVAFLLIGSIIFFTVDYIDDLDAAGRDGDGVDGAGLDVVPPQDEEPAEPSDGDDPIVIDSGTSGGGGGGGGGGGDTGTDEEDEDEGICGDGVVDSDLGETCDDGNVIGSDGCSPFCVEEEGPVCGDGNQDPGETCDDGNANNNDGCTNECIIAVCGDGILRIGFEDCDDGNLLNGDGCLSSCLVEPNWVCTLGDPSNCFVDTQGAADCSLDYFGLTPLTDFAPEETYFGMEGGLYPGNNNEPPAGHKEDAIAIANNVVPLNSAGQIDVNNGKIVLMSVGMSNTMQKFESFISRVSADPEINDKLITVNGAQGGSDLAKHLNVGQGGYTTTWNGYDSQLTSAGVTPEQVQVLWLEQAFAGPEVNFDGFTEHTDALDQDLGTLITVELLEKRYPNLKMVFVSGRARGFVLSDISGLNPEFWTYHNSFGVKKLIERQINGDPTLDYNNGNSPILLWGPYLWIDGVGPDGPGGIPGRADGMEWLCSDTEGDGTHPSDSGEGKVATQLIDFFKSQETTAPWMLEGGVAQLCQLNSAFWNPNQALGGDIVDMVLNGGNCLGESVSFEIYRIDAGNDVLVDQVSGVFNTDASLTVPWTVPVGGGGNLILPLITGASFVLFVFVIVRRRGLGG